MLGSGSSTSVDFLPSDDARAYVARELGTVARELGPAAQVPRILTEQPEAPRDLDQLFDLICGVQAEIGQDDVEFTLLELEGGEPPLPSGFEPLGDARGHMLHTFHRGDEYVMLFMPAMMRLAEMVTGSIARELGRIALHRRGRAVIDDPKLFEVRSELAGVALGMGVWIANASYVFENACCGGGCGIDLRSVRAALSMPEACFALALDARRKGLGRRAVGKHLASTQRAALKASWSFCRKAPQLALPPAGAEGGELPASVG